MLEDWKIGRLEGWNGGMVEWWKIGRLESWKIGKLEGWKVGRLESWKVGKKYVPDFTHWKKREYGFLPGACPDGIGKRGRRSEEDGVGGVLFFSVNSSVDG